MGQKLHHTRDVYEVEIERQQVAGTMDVFKAIASEAIQFGGVIGICLKLL
jgi:hypothetical protein